MKIYRYQGFGAIGCTNVSNVAGTSIHQLNPSLREQKTKRFQYSVRTDDGKVIQDYEFKPMNLDENMPNDNQVQTSENKLKSIADKISTHSTNFSVGHDFVEQMFASFYGNIGPNSNATDVNRTIYERNKSNETADNRFEDRPIPGLNQTTKYDKMKKAYFVRGQWIPESNINSWAGRTTA